MNWIDKLERKFGRFGIQNLTMYIIICYVVGYFLTYLNPSLMAMMSLDVAKILHGQIWRLVTWVIYPPTTGNFLLFVISILFFYYPIGTSLERTWGTFRYTLYIFSGLFFVVEAVTVFIFCIEYALRIWTANYLYPGMSKSKATIRFLVSFDGIVDLFTIIPAFFLSGFVIFRMLRVARIFHLFRLNAKYDSFNVITTVLYEKRNQIISSVFIVLILTVGYGDIYPITTLATCASAKRHDFEIE